MTLLFLIAGRASLWTALFLDITITVRNVVYGCHHIEESNLSSLSHFAKQIVQAWMLFVFLFIHRFFLSKTIPDTTKEGWVSGVELCEKVFRLQRQQRESIETQRKLKCNYFESHSEFVDPRFHKMGLGCWRGLCLSPQSCKLMMTVNGVRFALRGRVMYSTAYSRKRGGGPHFRL